MQIFWSEQALSDVEEIREVLLGSYRIVYRVADNGVSIATVFHMARLLGPEHLPNPD